jgi:UDP-N-acetylglucosamine--N-acetylmuramyl-(pentapeptide) pyrophosphoryl-undecaprenol N-acetylglucosamine transferase
VLEAAGAAVVVPDAELDAARLVHEVERLLSQPERLDHMSAAARRCARPRAADEVAGLIEEQATR